jgi:hypothetical protein
MCKSPAKLHTPLPAGWECPRCGHLASLSQGAGEPSVQSCVLCGNAELYRKKNFPHWLGLAILTVACLAFIVAHGFYHPWIAWAVLLGSAAFDGLLYLYVGDAVVCYRCGACHTSLPAPSAHQPFDLGVAERYRQERIRREQLQAKKGPPERVVEP